MRYTNHFAKFKSFKVLLSNIWPIKSFFSILSRKFSNSYFLIALFFASGMGFVWVAQYHFGLFQDLGKRATNTQQTSEIYEAQKSSSQLSNIPKVVSVEIVGDTVKSTIRITFDKPIEPEVYILENPNRIFIDLPEVEFSFDVHQRPAGGGLIETYRYGEVGEGKARIVLDAIHSINILKKEFLRTQDKNGGVFVIEINSTPSQREEDSKIKFQPSDPNVLQISKKMENQVQESSPIHRPVIVIDPGHGGVDSGAVGVRNLLEKEVVLKVAHKLNDRLSGRGLYKTILTRWSDDFVSLDERLDISKRHDSDLFISIHADSLDQSSMAQYIKGATVYTLSEKASDAEARAMAEKENASDYIAGIHTNEQKDDVEVKNILFDLVKRETSNFSADFSRSLVKSMRPHISLSRIPEKSAKFKVLKQTHTPAVLLELGYISNPKEAELLISEEWQNKVCDAIVFSIDDYFKNRSSRKVAN